MSRKIIRRLLTEAVQGSEIKIQRMPSIGYLIVNDQGAETVAKDEVDLKNVLRSFKAVGVQSVNDAISGKVMTIDKYTEKYGKLIEDFEEVDSNGDDVINSEDDFFDDPNEIDMNSPEYIPEPDADMDLNDELEDDIDFADAPTDDLDEYI